MTLGLVMAVITVVLFIMVPIVAIANLFSDNKKNNDHHCHHAKEEVSGCDAVKACADATSWAFEQAKICFDMSDDNRQEDRAALVR